MKKSSTQMQKKQQQRYKCALSRPDEKIEFLRANRELRVDKDVSDYRVRLKIVNEMRKAGLVAQTTYAGDIQIEKYVRMIEKNETNTTVNYPSL